MGNHGSCLTGILWSVLTIVLYAFAKRLHGRWRAWWTSPLLTAPALLLLLAGVIGAAVGEVLLNSLPLRSSLARGALFGMGAHGAGTARVLQIDSEIGSIAGLVMVFVGLLNVLTAPFVASLLARLR